MVAESPEGGPRRVRKWSKGGDALPREPPRKRGRPIGESQLPIGVGLCVYGVRGKLSGSGVTHVRAADSPLTLGMLHPGEQ